jgi:hypothetical protein
MDHEHEHSTSACPIAAECELTVDACQVWFETSAVRMSLSSQSFLPFSLTRGWVQWVAGPCPQNKATCRTLAVKVLNSKAGNTERARADLESEVNVLSTVRPSDGPHQSRVKDFRCPPSVEQNAITRAQGRSLFGRELLGGATQPFGIGATTRQSCRSSPCPRVARQTPTPSHAAPIRTPYQIHNTHPKR